MLPARNRRDLDDIPADVRERLAFVWLDTVDDALRHAIGMAVIEPETAEVSAS